MKLIQDNIRSICHEKGISMAELSRQSGVPYSTLKKWGVKPKMPGAISVLKVCKVLDVPAEDLLKGEE